MRAAEWPRDIQQLSNRKCFLKSARRSVNIKNILFWWKICSVDSDMFSSLSPPWTQSLLNGLEQQLSNKVEPSRILYTLIRESLDIRFVRNKNKWNTEVKSKIFEDFQSFAFRTLFYSIQHRHFERNIFGKGYKNLRIYLHRLILLFFSIFIEKNKIK